MYAIIQTGGKQYRVEKGDVIKVELVAGDVGSALEFSDVLLVSDGGVTKVGSPKVEHMIVRGELLGEVKGPKVVAFKYKRRKGYHRKVGHRQRYSQVKINDIASVK